MAYFLGRSLWYLEGLWLAFWNWYHIERPRRDAKIKFDQARCMLMTQEEFHRWFNTLTVDEFFAVMLTSPREEEEEDEG